MKVDSGVLLGFVIASPSFYLMIAPKVPLLRYSVSEFSLDILRGQIYRWGTIVALEVITACDISLTSFLMGTRTRLGHSFADGNEFVVL